jgi:ribosomal protein S18 acetylase RimI-like enzyme
MADRLLIFPYHHPSDLEIIADLLPRCRNSKTIFDKPTALGIRDLLQNTVVQKRTRIWTTHEGLPVGYMLVDDNNQLTFDFLKGFINSILEDQIIKQAGDFLQENLQILEETRLTAVAREEDEQRIAMFMRGGFKQQPEEYLQYEKDITPVLEETAIPAGFSLRQFKAETDLTDLIALYNSAFESDTMTNDIRKSIMDSPLYDPVLDLVVISADGQLVGYAISSIDKVSNQLAGKLEGSIDTIAVHPDHQKKGLAICLIERSLKIFKLYGMNKANLNTSNQYPAMQKAAEKAGFQLTGKRISFSKKIHKS